MICSPINLKLQEQRREMARNEREFEMSGFETRIKGTMNSKHWPVIFDVSCSLCLLIKVEQL